MKSAGTRLQAILLCSGMFGLTIFAFAGAMDCGYVFDDGVYIIDNVRLHQGLTRDVAAWAFTTFYAGNWHPLTWITLAADISIYRGNPSGLHLTNVMLHAANSVLLMLVLLTVTGSMWRSVLAAAVFAVHPLRVESVVWITERKDVLSLLFGLPAVWAYAVYSRKLSAGWYMLVALCLVLGLMAKPMIVTLPVLFLLLDYWPLRRFGGSASKLPDRVSQHRSSDTGHESSRIRCKPLSLVIEKLPLFALCAAASVVTFVAQREWGNVVQSVNLPSGMRAANAAVSYLAYIRKMIWPSDLAVYYPFPEKGVSAWQAVLACAALLTATAAAWRLRKSAPHLLVGWVWYLVAMLPVIGLVQVGSQAMADRYTYLPMVGLLIALVWSVPEPRTLAGKAAAGAAAAAVVAALTAQTRVVTTYWRNDATLFTRALEVTSRNWMAHYALGRALGAEEDYEEARYHLTKALDINPDYEDAQIALAVVLTRQGKSRQAIDIFSRILERNPRNTLARVNLAAAFVQLGRFDDAARALKYSRTIDPEGTAATIRRYKLQSLMPLDR